MKYAKLSWFLITFLLGFKYSYAQTCNCEVAFKWAVKEFEANDAGFQYIVNQKGREAYEAHNSAYLKRLTSITNADSCMRGVIQWAKFFRVGHFGFIVNKPVANNLKSVAAQKSNRSFVTNLKYQPTAKEFDANTFYLRIPTFDSRYKTFIDSVINSNRSAINSHKNLVIDILDNGGGDDRSFSEVIPFLYTNPIRNVSVARLSTPHNNEFWEAYLKQNNLSPSDQDYYAKVIKKLKDNIGKFVMLNDSVYTTRYPTVMENPKNVAILINSNKGSTAEQFLLAARQSKKVKLFGTTTMGELDISNMYSVTSPDGKYTLWYCMSKSLRIPEYAIDNKGISPDFFLDKSIPQSNWVPYVAEVINGW